MWHVTNLLWKYDSPERDFITFEDSAHSKSFRSMVAGISECKVARPEGLHHLNGGDAQGPDVGCLAVALL